MKIKKFLRNIVTFLSIHLLRIICLMTRLPEGAVPEGAFTARILGGPLAGMFLSMPALERLAFALGSYESHNTQYIQEILKKGDVFFDVGANIGYLTMVAAKSVGTEGKVISFEPDPRNHALLTSNIKNNGLENVKIKQLAISDTIGELTFAVFAYSLVSRIADDTVPDDASLITVKATTLDEMVYSDGLPKPNVIKVDVEGHEQAVLLGAERLIADARPIILIELWPDKSNDFLKSFLHKHNYEIKILLDSYFEGIHLPDIAAVPR